jgi:hypothetical protein
MGCDLPSFSATIPRSERAENEAGKAQKHSGFDLHKFSGFEIHATFFLFPVDNPPQKGYHLTVFTVACVKSP